MKGSGIIDECKALLAAGDVETVLRVSGEGLATLGEQGRSCADVAERIDIARDMLTLGAFHVAALGAANMHGEALETEVMLLLQVLYMRVSPPEAGNIFLAHLQDAFCLAAELLNRASGRDAFAAEHLGAVAGALGGLEVATARSFIKHDVECTAVVEQRSALIAADVEEAPQMYTLNGEPVSATMAMDVLADCAARLAALRGE